MPFSSFYRLWISSIGVAHNPHARVCSQNTLQSTGGLRRTIRHDHLPGVLAEANAHPASVMEGYPGGPAYSIDQCVQDSPVAHRIAAIFHPFGFPVWRGD